CSLSLQDWSGFAPDTRFRLAVLVFGGGFQRLKRIFPGQVRLGPGKSYAELNLGGAICTAGEALFAPVFS
ncbi:MAG: hypothetical protein AB3N24_10765, partial [Leisingera sp.]